MPSNVLTDEVIERVVREEWMREGISPTLHDVGVSIRLAKRLLDLAAEKQKVVGWALYHVETGRIAGSWPKSVKPNKTEHSDGWRTVALLEMEPADV